MENDKNVFSIISSVILLVIFTLFHPLYVNSESFKVRSSNSEQLRTALRVAESNGEDDVIFLNSGLYETGEEPFVFEAKDDFSLTLVGFDNSDCESCFPEITLFSGDDQSRIFSIIGKPGITNFEFRNIRFTSGFSTEGGGGLQIFNAKSVTIENCSFSGNKTFGNDNNTGAGFRLIGTAQEVLIDNSKFFSNESSDSGAGIFISFAESIVLTNNYFGHNNSKGVGGGASFFGNDVIVSNNVFNENTSKFRGGGLYTKSAFSPIVIDISNNVFSANISNGIGGGAYIESPILNMLSNEFIENSAAMSGGGGYLISDELLLSKNQFVDNWSGESGGGLSIQEFNGGFCDSEIKNNIFISNQSNTNGGGLDISIYCDDIDYKIINNTVILNSVDIEGGGIYFYGLQDDINFIPPRVQISILDIYNNIIFGNSAGNDGDDIYVRGKPTLEFSLFNNDFSDLCYFDFNLKCEGIPLSDNNINEDPLFVNAETGDISLQSDSPCIDAGDPNAPDLPDTDIFGNLRVPPPDMGAVEFIEEAIKSGGGCSMVRSPVSSSLAVFLVLPVLIIIRRLVKRYRS